MPYLTAACAPVEEDDESADESGDFDESDVSDVSDVSDDDVEDDVSEDAVGVVDVFLEGIYNFPLPLQVVQCE